MREVTTLQARTSWANFELSLHRAVRYLASALLMLIFSVAAAHAQMEPVNAPSAPSASTPKDAGTRSRRVSEASSSQSAASSRTHQAQAVETEEPSAATPEQPPKNDRITTLRAQITETTDKAERARLQRTLVDYLIALNRQSEAVKELREMMRENRVDPVGFYNIGNALARLGDTPTAIDAYRKAIEQRHGNYSRALNNLGVLLIRQERWDEALEALSSALRQENFRYGEASYNLGRVYAAQGNTKLAISEWTRALVSQPDHLDAALLLARALAGSGEMDRALSVIDRFIERQGPNKVMADARREILASGANSAAPATKP
ncbi:MAG TPA: tetratricopeptide repeat protein [Pyrinomonadaceae bacterium]|nr:tetratricopeptide repeat protein [Pyrinomonadaceae bacterium]